MYKKYYAYNIYKEVQEVSVKNRAIIINFTWKKNKRIEIKSKNTINAIKKYVSCVRK
jgi:hypothetical protein